MVVLAAALVRAEEKLPEGVQLLTYKGWPESYVLTSAETGIKVVIVPAVGGRVLHYGPDDANIMFESPGSDGKTLENTKGNFWVGGYQLDIGPELRGLPEHRRLWMGQYKARASGPYSVTVESEPCQKSGIQLSKVFTLDPKTGSLKVDQKMTNAWDKETQFCLWDRTLCKGGGFAFFPLNPKTKMKAGWGLRYKEDGKEYFDNDAPASPNVKILDGILVAEATAKDVAYGKLGADSDAGWMGYARGKQLYIKTFPYDPAGTYSDAGNSVEFYWSAQVGEVEPLSAEVRLKPGESHSFPEVWHLLKLDEDVSTFEQARALSGRAAKLAGK